MRERERERLAQLVVGGFCNSLITLVHSHQNLEATQGQPERTWMEATKKNLDCYADYLSSSLASKILSSLGVGHHDSMACIYYCFVL